MDSGLRYNTGGGGCQGHTSSAEAAQSSSQEYVYAPAPDCQAVSGHRVSGHVKRTLGLLPLLRDQSTLFGKGSGAQSSVVNGASNYHKPHAARTMASTAGPAILFPKHAESQICRVIVFAVFVSHTAMRGEARAFDRGSREVKLSAVGHTMANTQGATNNFMTTNGWGYTRGYRPPDARYRTQYQMRVIALWRQ